MDADFYDKNIQEKNQINCVNLTNRHFNCWHKSIKVYEEKQRKRVSIDRLISILYPTFIGGLSDHNKIHFYIIIILIIFLQQWLINNS